MRRLQGADVDVRAPEHLFGGIVEEDQVAACIDDERRRRQLRRERPGNDEHEIGLLALHRPILRRALSD
jgi:hypothetical protein